MPSVALQKRVLRLQIFSVIVIQFLVAVTELWTKATEGGKASVGSQFAGAVHHVGKAGRGSVGSKVTLSAFPVGKHRHER